MPSTDRRLTGDDAATAWVKAAHAYPGELIGLATGPLTNLALALRKEPALPTLLRRLVIMGGAYDYRGNTSPVAEWNIAVDPEAAAEVFAAWSPAETEGAEPQSLPILCGLDVTRNIAITPEILLRLAAAADATTTAMSVDDERGTRSSASNPLIRVIEDATRFYLESYYDLGHGYLAHLHDPLAAAVALDPQLVTTRPATVDVELTGTLTRGMTVTDWSGRWGRKPNALIGVGVDPAVFFDRFIDGSGRSRADSACRAFTRRSPPGTTAFGGSTAASRSRDRTPAAPPAAPGPGRYAPRRRWPPIRIPPAFVDRPWSGPPAQPLVTITGSKPRRIGGEQPAAGHADRVTLGVKQFHRIVEQHSRRRFGQLTGPRQTRVGTRYRLVAQRRQRDALGRPTTAGQYRHLHCLRTEQTLHPHQRPTGPHPVLVTQATPQR